MKQVIVFVFMLFGVSGGLTITKGLSCTVYGTKNEGVCAPLINCPELIPSITKGGPRTRCGFEGLVEIICCPKNLLASSETSGKPVEVSKPFESSAKPVQRPVVRPSPKPTSPVVQRPVVGLSAPASRIGDRISREKCIEYSTSVFGLVPTVTEFSQHTSFSHVDRCAIKTTSNDELQLIGQNELPHLAFIGSLVTDRIVQWMCTGTLISEKFVLTAASCVTRKQGAKVARFGVTAVLAESEDVLRSDVFVKNTITHAGTNANGDFCHDLAVMEFYSPLVFNERIRPACLPENEDNHYHAFLITATLGGSHSFNQGKFYKQLVNNYEFMQCSPADGKLCANFRTGGLYEYHSSQYCMYTVLGMTSYATTCSANGALKLRSVYPYLDWIERNVWG